MVSQTQALQARRRAESLMDSTGTITRQGARTLDQQTGQYVYASETIYSGPCKFRRGGTQVSGVESAGQLLTSQESILSLPVVGSESVREGDVWVCDSNPLDVALVGVRATIKAGVAQSFATARRFPVEVTDA